MSKASNKRAKKLDQSQYLDDLVVLDQKAKFAKQKDDDLFYIADGSTKALTPAQLRRQELTDLLFKKPDPPKKPYDPLANKKQLKKKTIIPHTTAYRHKKNKLMRREERRAEEAGEDQDVVAEASSADTEDDEAQEDAAQEVELDGDCSDPEFYADWIKYTGNLSKPIKALRKQHKKRFEEIRLAEEHKQRAFDRKYMGKPTQRKQTAVALANAYTSGVHMDHVDMVNSNEDRDIWDDDEAQQNAEGRKIKPRDLKVLEEYAEWLIPLAETGVKNRRHAATSKHVTAKQLVVAPAALSINPQREDMKALAQVYKRRLRGEKLAHKKVQRGLAGHINVKNVPNPSAKEVEYMHRTIYRPVETKVHKLKTRVERNTMKKKAENRYKHALALKEKRFEGNYKKIQATLEAWKRHQKYLKEKLPKIRAEIAEVKKDQPVKFGRNAYKAPKPELQTHSKMEASQGHLRRAHMSTNLLSDAFGALQRTNMIPAIGRSGKRAPKKQIMFKHTYAAGSRVGRIDVDEVMSNAKAKAQANPKPVNATKNPKRKLDQIKGFKAAGEKVDYGYDSDDDIWG